MKRIRLILLALLCSAPPLAAQNIRLSAGATFSSLKELNEGYDQSSGSTGYHFGGDLVFGKLLSIAPGIHWQSLAFDLTDEAADKTDGISLSGIQVPLMVGLGLDLKVVKARVYAGPTVTFLTGVGDNDFGLTKDDFTSTAFGGQIGASVDILMFSVEVGQEFPFSDLFASESPYGKGKLGVTRVGIAFTF